MYVINEKTRCWEYYDDPLVRCIVAYQNGLVEFGYVNPEETFCVNCLVNGEIHLAAYKLLKNKLNFDRFRGVYTFHKVLNAKVYARGNFPYTFNRYYNTRFLNDLFTARRKNYHNIPFKYSDELPYTFGLEFETSGGYIPEHQLFDLGLIPLRDGSISGLEYSTTVLQGKSGLNSLYKIVQCLQEYTTFDKECSLHIHLGNWKLNEATILKLNNLFSSVQLVPYLPRYTYHTEFYKETGKSYCRKNASYSTFEELYTALVGRPYYGDLYQPHPDDVGGSRKWNIRSRYKALNLINAICYNFGKTAEFRILRPSYNFDKIICWLYIFAAFIKYAEHNYRVTTSIKTVLDRVYSPDLAAILKQFLILEQKVVYQQTEQEDYIGADTSLEDSMITKENLAFNGNFFY